MPRKIMDPTVLPVSQAKIKAAAEIPVTKLPIIIHSIGKTLFSGVRRSAMGMNTAKTGVVKTANQNTHQSSRRRPAFCGDSGGTSFTAPVCVDYDASRVTVTYENQN